MCPRTVVWHVWRRKPTGERRLVEIDYRYYPDAVGHLAFVKVPNTERPCRCPELRHLTAAAAEHS
jgi:hypothetical protein